MAPSGDLTVPSTNVPTLKTQRENACPISLLGTARSPAAEGLVQQVLDAVILPHRGASERKKQVGDVTMLKLQTATTALLADLMNLARPSRRTNSPLAGAHGMSRSHFPSGKLGFGYDIFTEVVGALEAEGLLRRRVGYPRWGAPMGEKQGAATCFDITDRLIGMAAAAGVTTGDWEAHWTLRPSSVGEDGKRLELRAKRKTWRGDKLPSVELPVDLSDPKAAELDAQIERINRFLLSQDIDGLTFQGLRRIFNDGDQPDFAWNKGGRFYSIPGGQAYEQWNADDRQDRIIIKGEAVTEVDLRASHLTLLHALSGHPFDPSKDPYFIKDLPRLVVKLWVAQAIGLSNPTAKQWSRKSREGYSEALPGSWLEDDYPIRTVAGAVKKKHPLLIDLQSLGFSTLDLQYREAEILRLAMKQLMFAQGIPVLPIHDALIVPRSRTAEAERCLKDAFKKYVEGVTGRPCSVVPNVTLKET